MWMQHAVFFVGASLLAFVGFRFLENRDGRFALKTLAVSGFFILLLNANWIVGNFAGVGKTGEIVGRISQSDYQAFATDA
jgi:hypothetical protein